MIILIEDLFIYYNKMKSKSVNKNVIIITNNNLESICSTKILAELFKVDGINFKIIPVWKISELNQALIDSETIENVF